MGLEWKESIDQFIFTANKNGAKMLMVGGGAVNFHGYQRHLTKPFQLRFPEIRC